MNIPATATASLQEQAAHWVLTLHLEGEGVAAAAEWQAWLQQSDQHRLAYLDALAAWQGSAELGDLLADAARAPARSWARSWLPTGAGVTALVLALWFGPGVWLALSSDHYSRAGQQLSAVLDDGSQLQLSGDSALRVRFSDQERRVELLRGEAFFQVQPDPQRPFRVFADGRELQAVGTAYAVARNPGGVSLQVTEGRVAARFGAYSEQVQAGESLWLPDAADPVGPSPLELHRLAWREGRLVFVGQSLTEALAEIDRHLPERVLLLGGGDASVTAVLPIDQLNEGLPQLLAALGRSHTRIPGILILVR